MQTALPLLIADVYELAGRLRRRGEGIAREAGQSQPRWQVLSVASEGDWTVPHIAERLGVTRQSVQRVVDELIADKHAAYEANPHHRRSQLLRLTARGREALRQVTEAARKRSARLGARIPASDFAVTRRTLATLLEAVRAETTDD